MKKILSIITVVALAFVFTACKQETYEIAMITDVGTIDDESFNQGTWEGVKKYAEENDISHKYYKPTEKSDEAYLDAIDLAVKAGAEVVVTPGFLFERAIYEAQDEYKDVTFILIDGTPNNMNWDTGEGEYRTEDNVYPILFAEHESGFLAGYAAVKEGFTQLGFMGGMAVPAVVKFGYGYLQGAEFAAEEMGLGEDAITVKYNYLNDFQAAPEHKTKAASWYSGGTEVIFVAAGGAGRSIMNAAQDSTTDKYVIGVDVDQSTKSPTVITSAMKELANSVYLSLDAIYEEDESLFVPGETTILDVTNDGVGLPNDFSRFSTFTATDYDTIFTKLVQDTDAIRTDMVSDTSITANDLGLSKVTVTVVE